jgi:hypothetical protein
VTVPQFRQFWILLSRFYSAYSYCNEVIKWLVECTHKIQALHFEILNQLEECWWKVWTENVEWRQFVLCVYSSSFLFVAFHSTCLLLEGDGYHLCSSFTLFEGSSWRFSFKLQITQKPQQFWIDLFLVSTAHFLISFVLIL